MPAWQVHLITTGNRFQAFSPAHKWGTLGNRCFCNIYGPCYRSLKSYPDWSYLFSVYLSKLIALNQIAGCIHAIIVYKLCHKTVFDRLKRAIRLNKPYICQLLTNFSPPTLHHDMENSKYLATWKKYMPVIRLHIKKSIAEQADQQFKLNAIDFELAGGRQ